MSKDVKYVGTLPADIPSLGLAVVYGDVITVPGDFDNGLFTDVVTPAKVTKQPAQPDNTANAE